MGGTRSGSSHSQCRPDRTRCSDEHEPPGGEHEQQDTHRPGALVGEAEPPRRQPLQRTGRRAAHDGDVDQEVHGGEVQREAFAVPAGMLHRPVVPVRSAVLMIEKAGVVATGD
jgi:hypothetical protein